MNLCMHDCGTHLFTCIGHTSLWASDGAAVVSPLKILALAEISGQPNIDCVVRLLVIALIQIYSEKKQARQRERQNVQFEEKRSTRSYNGANSCAQGDERFKDKPGVKRNKGSGGLSARPHQAKLPTCGEELKKSLSSDRDH